MNKLIKCASEEINNLSELAYAVANGNKSEKNKISLNEVDSMTLINKIYKITKWSGAISDALKDV